ncbi:MAG: RES domain-containing protein, partial [Hyphomicrobium sp.]
IFFPSAVSRHSWNLILLRDTPKKPYALKAQERFAPGTRLYPPKQT